jgi:hypothetical protein
MPQLSLYIDEDTLERLKRAAALEKVSLSKYVSRRIRESVIDSWPPNYDALFGAIEDESFAAGRTPDFADDTPREKL